MLNMFVYGTLRRGEANDIQDVSARHGLAAPRFVGTATICGRLHDFGRFPGLVVSSTGVPVLGEVYEIADELRAILDEIERAYPEDDTLFDSQAVELEVGGRTCLACSIPLRPRRHSGCPRFALVTGWVTAVAEFLKTDRWKPS